MLMAAAAVVCDKCVLLVLSKSRHQEGWLIGFFELFVAIVSYRIARPPPARIALSYPDRCRLSFCFETCCHPPQANIELAFDVGEAELEVEAYLDEDDLESWEATVRTDILVRSAVSRLRLVEIFIVSCLPLRPPPASC